jgi:hypothetical protein
MKKHTLVLSMLAILATHCARPCPKDQDLGALSLTATGQSFLPTKQDVATMTFQSADGQTLNFNRHTNTSRSDEPVETLCERGDYLDKTTQVAKFTINNRYMGYTTPDNNYTLDLRLDVDNLGNYGSAADTVFFETFAVWGQRINAPVRVGTTSLIMHERGNSNEITATQRQQATDFRFVADTTLNNKPIKDAYVTRGDGNHTLFIFYTKTNGIEAFTTDTEVWVRQ